MITKLSFEFAICKSIDRCVYWLDSLGNGISWTNNFNANTHLVPTKRAAEALIRYHDLGSNCYVAGRRT